MYLCCDLGDSCLAGLGSVKGSCGGWGVMGKMGESGELGMVVAVSVELGSGPQVTHFVLWPCGVDVAGPWRS